MVASYFAGPDRVAEVGAPGVKWSTTSATAACGLLPVSLATTCAACIAAGKRACIISSISNQFMPLLPLLRPALNPAKPLSILRPSHRNSLCPACGLHLERRAFPARYRLHFSAITQRHRSSKEPVSFRWGRTQQAKAGIEQGMACAREPTAL